VRQVSLRAVFLMCVLLGAFSFQAYAQEATIVGTVTDPSGAAVPNVAISLTNTLTNQISRVTTNNEGQYVAPGLQIGRYTVRAEVTGFKAAEQKEIALAVGARARVDFTLEIGTARESVTVEAAPVAVQSESGEISDLFTETQVSQLAANGRSIYSLAALTAGASSNMPDYQSATPVGGNATISFNGLRVSQNIYMIDGGEDLDRGGSGTISVMPSMDSIAEFRQLTSNYGAEYSLAAGATMTLVFKSGSKDFHAGTWWFKRNESWDANSYFRNAAAQPKGLNRLNTYGFNVGGPVYFPGVYNKEKDKTFFFYNMEWRKQLQGGALNTVVPLTSTYTGDFGSTAIHVPAAAQLSAAQIARFAAAGLSPGQAFPNNKIPTSLLDPNAQALLNAKIFPAPTSGNRFVGGNNAPTNVREEIIRIDHHFSDKFWLFGHWVDDAIAATYGTTMWSGDNVPSASNTFGNPSYSGVIHAAYTISPTLLNETAFNYNGNRINILPGSNAIVARPSGFNVPRLFAGTNALNRIPAIALQGATGTNYTLNWVPWTNKADDYQIRDDFSWTHGSHQIKLGASWAIYKKIQTYFANTEGSFGFNGVYTGNDFADYLLGMASSYSEDAYQGAGHWDNQSWAIYAQDTWKASSRLTLNLALRWDGIPHTYDENNQQSNFYPNLYDPAKKALLCNGGNSICANSPGLGTSPLSALAGYQLYMNGIGIAGQNGIPRGLVQNHWNNFGPRVGFAYDITGKGKTVIRGGVGIYFQRMEGNDQYNGATNAPFGATVGFSNVSMSNPNLSLLTGQTLVAPINITGLTGTIYGDYKAPTTNQYSVSVQQQIGANSVLSVAYVGNQNRHLGNYTEINLPDQSNIPALIQGTVVKNTIVPYVGWGSIRLEGTNMNSHYNGLQLNFHSQFRDSLTLQAVYTYSKAMDPVNQGGGLNDLQNVSNPYDRNYDIGASPLDRRHIALVNFIYQFPFLKHSSDKVLKSLLGGWELSGIGTMESGFPLDITLGGAAGSNGLPNATNRPNSTSVSYPHTLTQWFSTSSFSAPALGAWGNSVHHSVYGPGRHNWNLSLFKSFTFSEARGSRFELRFETFNAFNHTQFQNVSSSFSAGDFGRVTSMYDARTIQLGAKLYF
jgi:hypothetical protein